MNREGQAEHRDGADVGGRAARHARTGRATPDDERQSLQVIAPKVLDHRLPCRVELLGRRGRAAARDHVGLLDERDGDPGLVGHLGCGGEVGRPNATRRTVPEHQPGDRLFHRTEVGRGRVRGASRPRAYGELSRRGRPGAAGVDSVSRLWLDSRLSQMTKTVTRTDAGATNGEPSVREANVEAFLDAAERLLIREGAAGISTRQLAREAGQNHGLVHYYFGSVDELLLQTFERFTDRVLDRQRAMYETDTPFAEKWRTAMGFIDEDLDSGYPKVWAEMEALAWIGRASRAPTRRERPVAFAAPRRAHRGDR